MLDESGPEIGQTDPFQSPLWLLLENRRDARGPRGLRAQSGSIPEGKPGSLELGVGVSAESQVDEFQETPLLSTHLTNVCAH